MTKFLRANQKKVLAVFGVLLMISFVATTGTGRSGYGRGETELGTYNHGKSTITGEDYDNFTGQWRLLTEKIGAVPMMTILGGGQTLSDDQVRGVLTDGRDLRVVMQFRDQALRLPGPFGDLARAEVVGERIFNQFHDHEDMYVLLAKEAQDMSVGANNDLIESVLVAHGITKDADSAAYNNMKLSLRTLLAVSNSADRLSSIAKVSQAEAVYLLHSQAQELSVSVIEFDARDYLGKVPAPTPQAIQQQFDKYKDKLPGDGPLAFGYKYPNRVKYGAVEIKRDAIRKAVGPIDVKDAATYYTKHKASFQSSTKPSSRPADNFTLNTTPTMVQQTFDEVKPRIVQILTDQRIEELLAKVRDAVLKTMQADYDAYKTAIDAKTPEPPSSVGVPYTDKDYLSKLKSKILADYKVELTIENQDAWQTPESLAHSTLGKQSYTTADSHTPFAVYMTTLIEKFVPPNPTGPTPRGDKKPVALWEPAPVFEDVTHDSFLIARAAAADPTHVPPSIDEVKARVVEDVKMAAANDLAKKAAQAARDEARKGKWLYAVAADQGKKAFTTGLFRRVDNRMGVFGAEPIPGYDLSGQTLATFKNDAFKLLSEPMRTGRSPRPATQPQPTTRPATRPAAAKPAVAAAAKPAAKTAAAHPATAPVVTNMKTHPVGFIELPSQAKIVVAEVYDLKPLWNKENQTAAYKTARGERRTDIQIALRLSWFNYPEIVKRMGYVSSAHSNKSNTPPSAPMPPLSPF